MLMQSETSKKLLVLTLLAAAVFLARMFHHEEPPPPTPPPVNCFELQNVKWFSDSSTHLVVSYELENHCQQNAGLYLTAALRDKDDNPVERICARHPRLGTPRFCSSDVFWHQLPTWQSKPSDNFPPGIYQQAIRIDTRTAPSTVAVQINRQWSEPDY
jgi:hypothetical protein